MVAVLNLFERDGDRTYDSSPVIDADGRLLGVTRMVHIMEGPGFHERGYYTPGDRESFVHRTAAGRIGVAICYDRHFPEYMRGPAPGRRRARRRAPGRGGRGVDRGHLRGRAPGGRLPERLLRRPGQPGRPGGRRSSSPASRSSSTPTAGSSPGRPAAATTSSTPIATSPKNASSHAARHFLEDRRPPVYGAMGLTDAEPEGPLMLRWYVINTKPKKESQVERLFSEGGFTIYCPKYVREKRDRAPFSRATRSSGSNSPNSSRWSNTPAASSASSATTTARRPIPDEVVEGIRARERDGLIVFERYGAGAGRRRRDRGRRGPAQGPEGHLPQGDRRQRAGDDPPELRLLPGHAAHRKRQAEESLAWGIPLFGFARESPLAPRPREPDSCGSTRQHRG